jgi:hypothetical protein
MCNIQNNTTIIAHKFNTINLHTLARVHNLHNINRFTPPIFFNKKG